MRIECESIGIIHTPYRETAGMPIQPSGAEGVRGTIEVFPEFGPGLADIDGFSHLILLYHFHNAGDVKLVVTPFLDSEQRGVFATRAPIRPSKIGLTVVKLIDRADCLLTIENIDVLDGTPLLDIKPYVDTFDSPAADRFGWLEAARRQSLSQAADDRFRK